MNADIKQKVADITTAYTSAISTAKEEITAAYTTAIATAISTLEISMKSWVGEQLANYYTIAQTDALLSTLKSELESQMAAQKSYLEGLITTLSESTSAQIAENKRLIDALRADLTETQADIATNSEKISDNASQIIANAKAIAENSENIEANEKLISDNKSLIEENASLIAANKSAISTLGSNVNKNTAAIAENATKIAQNADLIAQNATAITNNAAAIANNATEIANLKMQLETTAAEITAAYKEAIRTAINTLNGQLTDKIATEVATLNTRIDNEVATINATIEALTARVTALEQEVKSIKSAIYAIQGDIAEIKEQIAQIMSRIQSVSYVPQYADGNATMLYNCESGVIVAGTATLDYEIRPATVAAELAAVWQEALTVKAVYTQTRAVEFVELSINNVSAEDGILTVEISGSALSSSYFCGEKSANVRLEISDGNNSLTSDYVNMVPRSTDKLFIPDEAFNNYLVANFDTDNDGQISMDEAAAVTVINVSSSSPKISSLTGLTYFHNLERLECANNSISSVSLVKQTKLTYLDISNNNLSYLSISKNTSLEYVDCSNNRISSLSTVSGLLNLKQLYCNNNKITSLPLSDNKALTILDCHSNELAKLSLSNNYYLVSVDCGDNSMTSLIVRSSKLTTLDCSDNSLKTLSLSNLSSLSLLDCSHNTISELDVSDRTKLTSLNCSYNNLKTLNVSNNSKLHTLDCSNNSDLAEVWLKDDVQQAAINITKDSGTTICFHNGGLYIPDVNLRNYLLTNYDDDGDGVISAVEAANVTLVNCSGQGVSDLTGLESCLNLQTLDCSNNSITRISLPSLTKLQTLRIYGNPVNYIDISYCTALTYFYVMDSSTNALATPGYISLNKYNLSSSLTITSNGLENRHKLRVNSSTITSLDISNNNHYTHLYAQSCTNLMAMEYPQNLEVLDIQYCSAIQLDITELPDLKTLNAPRCNLSTVDVSQNTQLTKLYLDNNSLTKINVTQNTMLQELSITNNDLSAINVRNNIALTYLAISNNSNISVLNVSNNIALEALIASGLAITDIDLTANTALKGAELFNTNLTSIKKLNTTGLGIVYINKTLNGAGRIMSVTETSTSWGLYGTTTGATNADDGMKNVNTMKSKGYFNSSSAFTWCANYGTDWYLPALNELQAIYNNKSAINSTLSANGYTTLGTGSYWSSTEYSRYDAYKLSFSTGYSDENYKDYTYSVRAVLAF